LPPTLIISRNAIGIGRRRPVTHRYRRNQTWYVSRLKNEKFMKKVSEEMLPEYDFTGKKGARKIS
jgi:hypothetical protein